MGLSIVTICFNNPTEFLLTSRSIVEMKRLVPSVEWIVVDGSSNLDVLKVANSLEIVDVLIHEHDDGIADAWNKGIAAATESHVMIVNSGDEVIADNLVAVLDLLEPDKIIFSSIEVFHIKKGGVGLYRPRPSYLKYGMYVPHMGCLVPRSYYSMFGPYVNIRCSMDYEWFFRNLDNLQYTTRKDIVSGRFYLGGVSSQKIFKSFWIDYLIQTRGRVLSPTFLVFFLFRIIRHGLRRLII
jgi:glycosyltransferase involved in cell wall biosynthesis